MRVMPIQVTDTPEAGSEYTLSFMGVSYYVKASWNKVIREQGDLPEEALVDLVDEYPGIDCWWDCYGPHLQDHRQLLIRNGYGPNVLFVTRPEGILFWWWGIGGEDMSKTLIPYGAFVLCPIEWFDLLAGRGLNLIPHFGSRTI